MRGQTAQRPGNSGPKRANGGGGRRNCPQNSNYPLAPAKRIVLAGNPNVGKSVVFHFLTRKYAEVSNYPGTTVEVSRGRWQCHEVPIPGVYGLNCANDEERLGEIIDKAEIIVNVVDATVAQGFVPDPAVAGLGKPMLVVVNMMDEARRSGRVPDLAVWNRAGVPVLPCRGGEGCRSWPGSWPGFAGTPLAGAAVHHPAARAGANGPMPSAPPSPGCPTAILSSPPRTGG